MLAFWLTMAGTSGRTRAGRRAAGVPETQA